MVAATNNGEQGHLQQLVRAVADQYPVLGHVGVGSQALSDLAQVEVGVARPVAASDALPNFFL